MRFHWVPGSTSRIAQLTGDYDPEGFPHYTNTREWGVEGVDGGVNTELDGRTFVFFGDAAQTQNVDTQFGDPRAFIEDAPFPRGARLAVASRSSDHLDAFFVGTDGALYVAWVMKSEQWQGPIRVGSRDLAPPGAGVATAPQGADQLNVFFIGNNGALHVAWVGRDGIWREPVAIGPSGLSDPGVPVAAARLTDDLLYAFYFDKNGRMCVHAVSGAAGWMGPEVLAPGAPSASVATSGTSIAAIKQTDDQLSVFFIGRDQKLNVYWIKPGDNWHGPFSVGTKPNIAPAGACLAAVKQLPSLTTVLFFGHDRKLTMQCVEDDGSWSEPIAMGMDPIAAPGSAVACVVRPPRDGTPSRLHALAMSEAGDLIEYYVDGIESWRGPCVIAIRTGASPGSPLVATRQNAIQSTVLHGGFTTELKVSWVPDTLDVPGDDLKRDDHDKVLLRWGGPDRINPFMVKLVPVLNAQGTFAPFEVEEGNATSSLPMDSAPEGAFTYEGCAYVFIMRLVSSNPFNLERSPQASLTRSFNPGKAQPFKHVFDFSGGPRQDSGRFWHVTPYRVRTAELPGFSHPASEGVILLGMGRASNPEGFGVHLAWLPLVPGQVPKEKEICFYTGDGPNGWSSTEQKATPLFRTKYDWASMSLGRIPRTGHWILLYHRGGRRPHAEERLRNPQPEHDTVVARVAETPWELDEEHAPEIVILDPYRDKALDPVSNYMYREGEPDPRNLKYRGKPLGIHPAFFYGPALLNRYTEFDDRTDTATFHFLISTGWPYQVQLMRTALGVTRGVTFSRGDAEIPSNASSVLTAKNAK